MKEVFCIFFVSWTLVQYCLTIPTPFDSNEEYLKSHDLCHQRQNFSDMAPGEKDSNVAASIQLQKMTFYALQDATLTYARKANHICELMLKDSALNENHSEEVQEFKQTIVKFLEFYKSCSGMEELLKLIDFYGKFTSQYYNMEKEDDELTADGEIILDVLKKYDSQMMDGEIQSYFNMFVSNFTKKINELEVDLKKENGELPVKIIEWWEEAKNMKEDKERLISFANFMKLYRDYKKGISENRQNNKVT